MIVLVSGENRYQQRHEMARLTVGRAVEQHDGAILDSARTAELLSAQSLFASTDTRAIVITEASSNKTLWQELETQLSHVDDETLVVLLEVKPDKRTKTYKWLQKNSRIVDCSPWKPAEASQAVQWLKSYATKRQVLLARDLVDEMVERAIRPSDIDNKPMIDQERLAGAVDQLVHVEGEVDRQMLDAIMAPSTHENMFILLSRAIEGDTVGVQSMIRHVRQVEDGHRAMGLLASQATSLAALVLADESRSTPQVAHDIGAHPYALGQLSGVAHQISRAQLSIVIGELTRADSRLKRGKAEAWALIETALVTIATRRS